MTTSAVQTGLWVVALLSVALWCVGRAIDRAPRSIAVASRVMRGETSDGAAGVVGRVMGSVVGRRVSAAVASDLELADTTATAFNSRLVLCAGLVGFVLLGGVGGVIALGMLPVSPLWLLVPALGAALAAWLQVHDVRSKAARARSCMRLATHDLVQLVAVALTTDVSVEEAVRFALDFGETAAHDRLRGAVRSAPQRGLTVWEALHAVGERFECRELREFAVALERQGVEGVSITQSVTSMAQSMRSVALDQLERDADRANAQLSGPTVGFVIATVVFLAYPLAQRINDAFGG